MKRNLARIGMAAVLGALVAGAAILTSCATPGDRVAVLTYNTHLFGESNAESAQNLKNLVGKDNVVVLDDEERFNKLVEELKRGDADVVALQELWACDRPMNLADRLREVYPHRYYSKQPCEYASSIKLAGETLGEFVRRHPVLAGGLVVPVRGVPLTSAAILLIGKHYNDFEPIAIEIIKRKYKLTDGLLLLSKYPIDNAAFQAFPLDRAKDANDRLARKGVITATIAFPNGLRLRVGVTHANVDIGGPGQPDLADLASWTTAGGSDTGPAIMMGDFNVSDIGREGADYRKMADIFAGVGALDAYRQANNHSGVTVSWAANPLMQVFYPGASAEQKKPQCIDHVFYRPGGSGFTIKPAAAKVITDWKYPHKTKQKTVESWDVSDHYPVLVTFEASKGPNPVTR